MKEIGILGGTLDPIHNGHLMIAECARDQLNLDEVWFMPTGNPPHKSNQNISPNEVRKEMIELAIEDNNNFKFSDFEYKRDGIIYTSDTMRLLKNAYKDTDFYFIMGADSLMYFKDWHKPEEIVLYCNLVVAGRDNDDSELLREVAILEDKYNINIHVLKSPKICISSSDIRDYINNKFSIKYMVPDSVERYIKNKNLYVK